MSTKKLKAAAPDQPPGPPPNQKELDEKLVSARVGAAYLWPYMAPALYRLVPRWVNAAAGLPTMGVDRYWRLYLCREYVATLPAAQLALLLVGHELQHLMGGHSVRMRQYTGVSLVGKDGSKLDLRNAAGDLAINEQFVQWIEAGKEHVRAQSRPEIPLKIPEDGMYAEKMVDDLNNPFPRHETAEVYADLLFRMAEKNGKAPDGAACKCGSGAGMDPGDAPWEDKTAADPKDTLTGVTPEEADTIGRQVAEKVAEQVRKNQGSVPAGMRFWAEVMLKPAKVPWQHVVRRLVRNGWNVVAGRKFHSYSRPNRRNGGWGGVVLPGKFSVRPTLTVVLDTSGSMGKKDYEAAFSEIQAVLNQNLTGEDTIPVMCCDAATAPVQYIRRFSDLKMVGGGGTDMSLGLFTAAQTKVGKNRKPPALVVVMTDGYTGWPDVPVRGIKVLAVLTNRDCTPPPPWIQHCFACD